MSDDEEPLVHAAWSRSFPLITVLAFADRSYTMMLGGSQKPPFLELGWYRRRPTSLSFPRWRRL
jgi:hypothetical protein